MASSAGYIKLSARVSCVSTPVFSLTTVTGRSFSYDCCYDTNLSNSEPDECGTACTSTVVSTRIFAGNAIDASVDAIAYVPISVCCKTQFNCSAGF